MSSVKNVQKMFLECYKDFSKCDVGLELLQSHWRLTNVVYRCMMNFVVTCSFHSLIMCFRSKWININSGFCITHIRSRFVTSFMAHAVCTCKQHEVLQYELCFLKNQQTTFNKVQTFWKQNLVFDMRWKDMQNWMSPTLCT